MSASTEGRVSRQDIEAKLRQIRGDVDTAGEAAKGVGAIVAAVGGAAVVAIAYLLGRKRGKRSSTVVEVKRL